MHACWRVMRASFRLRGDTVLVSGEARRELRWWAAHLEAAVVGGVLLASVMMPQIGVGCAAVYADASTSGGFMAWTVVDGTLLFAVGEWTEAEQQRLGIAELELLASTFGLVWRLSGGCRGVSCPSRITRWRRRRCGRRRYARRGCSRS